MENTIVSKLSLGTMGIKGAAVLGQPQDVRSLRVATIYGKVGGFKTVEDKLTGQIHTPVTGTFVGVNHLDKDSEYQSGLLYLPSGIHDQLLDAAKKLMDESDSVDFALEISAVRSSNAAGYSYEAKPLIKPTGVDPLDSIRKMLPGYKALAAGTEEAAKEHVKTEEKKPEPVKPAAKK
jgi:hypothetical protein